MSSTKTTPPQEQQLELWPAPKLADDEVILFGQVMKVGKPYDFGAFRVAVLDADYTVARGNKRPDRKRGD